MTTATVPVPVVFNASMKSDARKAYRFFRSQDIPARAAWRFAKAEAIGQRLGLSYRWGADEEGAAYVDVQFSECELLTVLGYKNEVLTTLGCILDATATDRRICEAFTTEQAIQDLNKQPSTLPRWSDDHKLMRYADGGYPFWYLTADGGSLCPDCANGANGSEAHEWHTDTQWRVVACDVHYEGEPIICDHCGAAIESAYGIPGDN